MNSTEAKQTLTAAICEAEIGAGLREDRDASRLRITVTKPQEPPLVNPPKSARESYVTLPTFMEIV